MAEELPASDGRVTQAPNPLNTHDGPWRSVGEIAAKLLQDARKRAEERSPE